MFVSQLLTLVIVLLFLELSSDKVHVKEFLLPFVQVRVQVITLFHDQVKARSDTV